MKQVKFVFQPGKKYADLSQGTIFKEVAYEDYKNTGFDIDPDDIDNLIEKITSLRVNTLRISATPNNPQSSEGICF